MKPSGLPYLTIVVLLLPSSLVAQSGEYRLGVFLRSSDRNMQIAPNVGRGSATLRGAELLVRNDVAALFASYSTGEFSATSGIGGDGPVREARALVGLGPPELTLEGGYYRRARGSSLSEQSENLIQLGARSTLNLGPSGFVISLAAATFVRSDSTLGSSNELRPVGWIAETGLLYQAPRGLPFYASLGYRYERIRSNRNVTPVRHEELSAIVFGVGLRFVPRIKEPPPAATP